MALLAKAFQFVFLYVCIMGLIILATYLFAGIYCFFQWDWSIMSEIIHWFNPANSVGMRIMYIATLLMYSCFFWIMDQYL